MKIAVVAPPTDRVPGGGSIAIWIQELTSRLAERHAVTVFSADPGDTTATESLGDVQHVRISTERDRHVERLLRAASRRLDRDERLFHRFWTFGAAYYRNYGRALAAQIRGRGTDAILLSNLHQLVSPVRRHNPGARIALMMHCDWLVELPAHGVARSLAGADAICGCSEHVAGGIARRFPALAARCHPVQNGSNPERFMRTQDLRERSAALRAKLRLEGRRVILSVGRVCPEKGAHVLVEAMRHVVRECDDAVLLVAGSFSQQPPSPRWIWGRDAESALFEALKPGYRERLEASARELGDRVRFQRKVPYSDLPAYYGAADLFVHPAVWQEPFGMILTEAMASGLPVVSTRAGGIPEIVIDGETGLLAQPGDAQGLADAILALVRDGKRCREMGERGLARLRKHFTWAHTARRMERVLIFPDA